MIVIMPPIVTENASGINNRDGGIFTSCDSTATAGISRVAAETLFMHEERSAEITIITAMETLSLVPAWRWINRAMASLTPVTRRAPATKRVETITTTTGEENPANASSVET